MIDRRNLSSFAPEAALLAGVGLICAAGLAGQSASVELVDRALLLQTGLLGLAYAGASWNGAPARQGLALTPPTRPLSLRGGTAAVLGLIGLSFALNLLLVSTGMRESSVLVEFEEHLRSQRGLKVLYALAGMAVIPAVAEELFFRGFLLGWLRVRWGSTVALLASSILFGLAHLDLAQGSAAAILGLYLGGIRLRTGSVHGAIVCHAGNNAVAVLGPLLLASS